MPGSGTNPLRALLPSRDATRRPDLGPIPKAAGPALQPVSDRPGGLFHSFRDGDSGHLEEEIVG